MRVTNNITTGQFLRNNRRTLTSMLRSQNRITTQRKFNRVSEDSVNGSKAMTIRRQLRDLDIYEDNLNTSKEIFAAAESNLYTVAHDIYINLEEKLVTAVNDTYDAFDLDVISVEVEQLAEQMVNTMNVDFAERQLFGGTSNGKTPFAIVEEAVLDDAGNPVVDDAGNAVMKKFVTYNGVKVNDSADAGSYPGSNPIYVDIGLGIKYNENYEVDAQTALDISLNGAEILGCGEDEDGYSMNLIQLTLDAAEAMRNNDRATVNAIIDRANEANNHILTQIAKLGTKQNIIDFQLSKTEEYRFNLQDRQNLVEGTDMEEEIINYEAVMAAYDASLNIGAQLLPKSIFDFI
ncbi:MAG: hypothetical protein IJ305_00920 [Oscillospiraceae bacterium]|nr:hypothetical protein [Oscillospiraceae bacterium]